MNFPCWDGPFFGGTCSFAGGMIFCHISYEWLILHSCSIPPLVRHKNSFGSNTVSCNICFVQVLLFQVSSVVLNNNIMHALDFESCIVEFGVFPPFNGFELYMFQSSQSKLIEQQFYIVVSDLNVQ